jgi:LmbE family N-acetylglucosaminyl deacetylase
MKRVLAFGCHPDDVEFAIAGTLVLLADYGYEIHIATMTGGEVGSSVLTSQQIRKKRLKEAERAAGVINGYYHFAGGKDCEVEYNSEYRRKAVRIMREVSPEIVITNPPSDYMIDHEETSRLVRNAAFIASVPLYDCGVPTEPMDKVPYLYYCNAIGLKDVFGRPLPLHFVIDISSVMNRKEQMLGCHKSQKEWLQYINGWDAYTENMKENSRKEGELAGFPFGESFIQHLGVPHPQDNILKKILANYYHEILE